MEINNIICYLHKRAAVISKGFIHFLAQNKTTITFVHSRRMEMQTYWYAAS